MNRAMDSEEPLPSETVETFHTPIGPIGRPGKTSEFVLAEQQPSSTKATEAWGADDGSIVGRTVSGDCGVDEASLGVCFLGNSFTSYNDLPGTVAELLISGGVARKIVTGRCIRSGASLDDLMKHGGQRSSEEPWNREWSDSASTVKELLQRRPWDFIVIQDNSRSAAGGEKAWNVDALGRMVPDILASGATVILYKTHAYRSRNAVSTDYGEHDEMLTKLTEGYAAYEKVLRDAGVQHRLAPAGDAWALARNEDQDLWRRFFCGDDFHAGPVGTYVSSCVVFATLAGKSPCGLQADLSSFSGIDAWLGNHEPKPLPIEGQLRERLEGFAARACGL